MFIRTLRPVGLPFDLTTPSTVRMLSNMPGFSSEAALIDEVHQRLVHKFSHVPIDQISATVANAHARFEHSRVRHFIPLLVSDSLARNLLRDELASPPQTQQHPDARWTSTRFGPPLKQDDGPI